MKSIGSKLGTIKSQKGLTLILVSLVLVIFIFFSALAIDVTHALMNKTRLQNGVDAAALAAAVKVSRGSTDAEAEASARETLTDMYNASGNTEISISSDLITVMFSNDPQDFSGAYVESLDTYVRVAVSKLPLTSFFLGFFGADKLASVSAVAGPSSSIVNYCNVVPMAVCAETTSGSNDYYGYNYKQIYELKVADQNATEMGPGNFQLLDFGTGASDVRTYLAGGYEDCVNIEESVITKPGASMGPVGQGLNTRFGEYGQAGLSAEEFPPDQFIKEPSTLASTDSDTGEVIYDSAIDGGWYYEQYEKGAEECPMAEGCTGEKPNNRRILAIPLVNCDGASGGTTLLDVISVGCFFLLQKAPTNAGGDVGVYGEFIKGCEITNGTTSEIPNDEGVFRIQLYRDPLSVNGDS